MSRLYPYLLLTPAMLILIAMVIYPLIYSLSQSFTDFNLIMLNGVWVGLKNYATALQDPDFLQSALFTLIFAFMSTGVQLVLGFFTALCLARVVWARGIITIIMMFPMMVTPVVVGILWLLMFQPDYSVINGLLAKIGIHGPIWLQQPATARIAVIVADIWQWTPFFTIILLAGILNLPREVLEAGEVDGATSFQSLTLISIPMLMPLILITTLIRLIDSFKTFDSIFVMTNGGPGASTEVMSLYIYRKGLPYMEMGYASALSYLFVILLTVIATLLIRQLSRSPQ
jgi:multiple sugar transport system permease protein